MLGSKRTVNFRLTNEFPSIFRNFLGCTNESTGTRTNSKWQIQMLGSKRTVKNSDWRTNFSRMFVFVSGTRTNRWVHERIQNDKFKCWDQNGQWISDLRTNFRRIFVIASGTRTNRRVHERIQNDKFKCWDQNGRWIWDLRTNFHRIFVSFQVYERIDGYMNESKMTNSNVGIKMDGEFRIYERIFIEFSYLLRV